MVFYTCVWLSVEISATSYHLQSHYELVSQTGSCCFSSVFSEWPTVEELNVTVKKKWIKKYVFFFQILIICTKFSLQSWQKNTAVQEDWVYLPTTVCFIKYIIKTHLQYKQFHNYNSSAKQMYRLLTYHYSRVYDMSLLNVQKHNEMPCIVLHPLKSL